MIIRIPASKIPKHTQYARAHAHTHVHTICLQPHTRRGISKDNTKPRKLLCCLIYQTKNVKTEITYLERRK